MLLSVPFHVPADEFLEMASEALDSLPAPLRARLDADNLMITIQEGATAADREEGVDGRVLGYFQGGDDSVFAPSPYPKRIVLLQGNIERICRTRAELVREVQDTLLHEVAHYFGMSHRDLEQTRLHP